jgi:hypothetical protein
VDEPPEPAVEETADNDPPVSATRAERSARRRRSNGWSEAVVGAAVAFAVPVLLGEVLGLSVALASSSPRPSGLVFAKLGALFFYAFAHVPLAASVQGGGLPALSGTGFAAVAGVLSITPLAGTALVLWLLARAGRGVAAAAGGDTTLARAGHGAKVALPFAALCGLAGLALRVTVPLGGGSVTLSPSRVGAIAWPAILALVAGAAGGARACPTPGPWWRAGRDGVRTLGIALAFAVVGLAGLAPSNPGPTDAYFAPFQSGAAAGLARVALTVAVLPNLALWVLFPSMGGCLGLTAQQASGGFSVCLLSYTQFPPAGGIAGIAQRSPGFDLPSPPASYLLFVLVPLVAVVIGGRLAARAGGMRAAVAAGVAFAAAAVAFGYLSGVRVSISGSTAGAGETVSALLRPELLVGGLLALAWGVVGGVAGAAGRRRRPAAPPADIEAAPTDSPSDPSP